MQLNSIRSKVSRFIYAIFGLLIVILLIRMFFTLIGINMNATIAKFWFKDLSNPIITPFQDIYQRWFFIFNIENAGILAILVFIFLSVIITKSATFFLERYPSQMILNIVDLIFKILEFVLFFRFILVLTGGKFVRFAKLINNISYIVYEPFAGLLPAIKIGNIGAIELSTLVAIVFIIIFDIVSENILKSLFDIDDNDMYDIPTQTQANIITQRQPDQNVNPNITINVANGMPTKYNNANNTSPLSNEGIVRAEEVSTEYPISNN